ncbi:MAG: hypothetical protein DMG70_06365 [Acidobacteria bacterium]|nr:MAG: hypothetical protein DMG70_06365 [Acidobacteriota bacterium]
MGRVMGQGMMLGIAAAIAVFGTPIVAHGQTLTCAPGTTTLFRAVGPQAAQILVPAQVPVTICSHHATIVSVLPSGPASAPMIIPVETNVRTCVPTTVASTPVAGGGLQPPLQFVQVGSGVFAVNLAAPTTLATPAPAGVTVLSTAFTCF